MTKTSALRIRIEPTLHQEFIETCKAQNLKASEVLRNFMKSYVQASAHGKQEDLFPKEQA